MKRTFSRRDFLKLGALSLGALAFKPFPPPTDEYDYPAGDIGRVTVDGVAVIRKLPTDSSPIVRTPYQDELLNIYYEVTPETGPAYNPVWYRVWGGFVHRGRIQRSRVRFNTPAASIPERGYQLAEVTVPFTDSYQYLGGDRWRQVNRLYYETTHWVVGIEEGPDGRPWYRIYDELIELVDYFVPATHLRLIPDEELSPISPDVPAHQKRIEVLIAHQTLRAYENENVVFETKVSTGIPGNDAPVGWATPKGNFHITSKMPTKHMGEGILTAAADVYTLPGVPWTSFYMFEIGVAFHGTYWHDNFGIPMSHGCVNMRSSDAKWLFRWNTPIFPPPETQAIYWERTGYGTRVDVI